MYEALYVWECYNCEKELCGTFGQMPNRCPCGGMIFLLPVIWVVPDRTPGPHNFGWMKY